MKKLILLLISVIVFSQCTKEDTPAPTTPTTNTIPTNANLAGNYLLCTNSPYYSPTQRNLTISYVQTLPSNSHLYLIKEPQVGSFLSTTSGFYENYVDFTNNRDSCKNNSTSTVYFTNMSLKNDTLRVWARTKFTPATFTTLLYEKQ